MEQINLLTYVSVFNIINKGWAHQKPMQSSDSNVCTVTLTAQFSLVGWNWTLIWSLYFRHESPSFTKIWKKKKNIWKKLSFFKINSNRNLSLVPAVVSLRLFEDKMSSLSQWRLPHRLIRPQTFHPPLHPLPGCVLGYACCRSAAAPSGQSWRAAVASRVSRPRLSFTSCPSVCRCCVFCHLNRQFEPHRAVKRENSNQFCSFRTPELSNLTISCKNKSEC